MPEGVRIHHLFIQSIFVCIVFEMNKYLEFLHKDRLRVKAVKVQQKNFLENVISNADYISAFGVQVKITDFHMLDFDLDQFAHACPGRSQIPDHEVPLHVTVLLELLFQKANRSSGYLFLNRYGERITTRGISQQLKNYADKYGLDKKVN